LEKEIKMITAKTENGRITGYSFPELVKEIPCLFSSAGKARVIKQKGSVIMVRVELRKPARVRRHGRGINVLYSIGRVCSFPIAFHIYLASPAVRNGDREVILYVDLAISSWSSIRTPDEAREELRKFAEAMNRTWHPCVHGSVRRIMIANALTTPRWSPIAQLEALFSN
jgi:hypothetical protein